jgi:hypothetical protein
VSDERDTDFVINWSHYPKLAGIFQHRPTVNIYWEELRELIRDARGDAVRFIQDARSEELRKAYERGVEVGKKIAT